MIDKNKWGGSRPGAGRPRTSRQEKVLKGTFRKDRDYDRPKPKERHESSFLTAKIWYELWHDVENPGFEDVRRFFAEGDPAINVHEPGCGCAMCSAS